MNRRRFLEVTGKGGLAALLGGCANANLLTRNERSEFTPVDIELIPFEMFYFESNPDEIKLEDELLRIYLREEYSLNELHLVPMNAGNIEKKRRKPKIKDFDKFKAKVISVANELGVTEDQINRLSVHNSLMLSGRIVAHRLEYNDGMISKEEEELSKDPKKLATTIFTEALSGNVIDRRNQEAKRIDDLSADEIFVEGSGICRNYSPVNVAVFEVLKTMNSGLRNTYMRDYSAESIVQSLALPHAWNLVSTLRLGKEGLEVFVTYVDPTWLDTRNRTANNTDNKEKVEDAKIYDAFDGRHFGPGTCYALSYLAELYEVLGNDGRKITSNSDIRISDEQSVFYMGKAFDQRLMTCEELLAQIEADPKNLMLPFIFNDSFQMAVEDMAGVQTGILFEYGLQSGLPKNLKKFEKLKEIYRRAAIEIPAAITERSIVYHGDKPHEETSVKELFEKVEEEYRK